MAGIDANTVMMLHLDNNVTDVSQNNFTVTNSNITFTNVSPVFAGTSYAVGFLGASGFLSSPSGSVVTGTGDQTIDTWINANLLGWMAVCNDWTDSNDFQIIRIQTDGTVWVYRFVSGSLWGLGILQSASGVVSANTWTHIAQVRFGNSWTLYVGGVSKLTWTDSSSYPSYTTRFIGYFGGVGDPQSDQMSEFRVSNIARWTSNFTPPSVPYSAAGGSTGIMTPKGGIWGDL